MPIRRYVEHGVVFSPEVLAAMGKAFEGATATLGIASETDRQAVAKFIIRKAREDENVDVAVLRDKAVAEFGALGAASASSEQARTA
jgi:hypothetical protein